MAFGESAEIYNQARKPYPEQIIKNIERNIVKETYTKLIDLGCGTGISSRQLAAIGVSIIGCDIDPDMINIAKEIGGDNINYQVMPAAQLQFPDISVDAITAFGSFHWFSDTQSISEINRVLKKKKNIFIVNKNDNSFFKQEIHNIIAKFCEPKFIDHKNNYNPRQVLENNGFADVSESSYAYSELYSMDELLILIQSMKFWGYIATEHKPIILSEISNYFVPRLFNGHYNRSLIASLIQATKA